MDYIFNIRAKFDKASQTQVLLGFKQLKHDVETNDAYKIKIQATLDTKSLDTSELQKSITQVLNNHKFNLQVGKVSFDQNGSDSSLANAVSDVRNKIQSAMSKINVSGFNVGNYRTLLSEMGLDDTSINKAVQGLQNLGIQITKISGTDYGTNAQGHNTISAIIQGEDQLGRVVTLSQKIKVTTDEEKNLITDISNQIINVTDNIKQQAQAQERATKAYTQQRTEMEKTMAAAREMWALQNDRKNPISNAGITNTAAEGDLPILNAGADASEKAVKFKEAYNAWIDVIKKANEELEKQKKISAETTIELERTEKAAITASKSAISERTTQTDFRTKDVAAEIEKATADLTVFEKELSKVGMSLDDVRNKEGETLRDLLKNAEATSSSNAFGKYLDQLAIAKAKLREVKAEQDNAGESIKKLQDLTSKGLFAQNPNDDRVKTLRQDIGDLATTYQQLQTQFQNEGMTESVRQGFAQLSGQLQSTSERAKELQSSLKSAKDAAALEDRKSNLNNKIETWLRNNTRASESMRQSMKSLQTQIQSADKQTLTHLTQQFNELNRTAQQTGQIGKSALDIFKEKASKFAGWFGLANAFMWITNEGKQAVVTLKDVDSILTEISKTSERSAESLEKLGETAFDAASKYGVSVQNYLTGVQEMARAGYETMGEGQSEKMAELALLAQAAGDVTDSVARDYLIATDAAYQLGGSIEKLQTILDGQNKVNIKCPHIQKCMCA